MFFKLLSAYAGPPVEIKCLIGYKTHQNIESISQPAVGQVILDVNNMIIWKVVSPPDFLDLAKCIRTLPFILKVCFNSQSVRPQPVSHLYFCSLCNSTTRSVCLEKRVERRQVSHCQTKTPCGFNWLYFISVMITSPIDPVVPGHPISCWTSHHSNNMTILLKPVVEIN